MLAFVLKLFNPCLPGQRSRSAASDTRQYTLVRTPHRSRWLVALAFALLGVSVSSEAAGWGAAASMATASQAHTATLLTSGKVLVAGRSSPGSGTAVATTEIYDPASNSWSSGGNLATARFWATATLLPSGKVLLVAGIGPGSAMLNSAELYDPASNSWSSAGNLATLRINHTATLLPSGKVLVAGGGNTGGALSSAELYDPATNTWSNVGNLATARVNHTATLLPSGKVLVAGGAASLSGVAYATTELYDPATGNWSAAASFTTARSLHTATLLATGKVLIACGQGSNGSTVLNTAQLYDPVSNTWAAAASLTDSRAFHTASLLPSGKVLVTAGFGLTSTELYDPALNTWSSGGNLSTTRLLHTATLLATGKLLVAGGAATLSGSSLSSAELYDPAGNTYVGAGALANARNQHSATLLTSGKVLVAGGNNGGVALSSAELYTPASNNWSTVGALATVRYAHTATLLASGKVLVVGGQGSGGSALSSAELYDPVSNTWSNAGSLGAARYAHTATLLSSGKVLVTGGTTTGIGAVNSADIYDADSNTWSGAVAMGTARLLHTATLLPSGKVLVASGAPGISPAAALNSAELYDPTTNIWTSAATLATARAKATATLLPSGKVLVASGQDSGGGGNQLTSAELYDPTGNAWTSAGGLSFPHPGSTATLLPSGKVLVAGGTAFGNVDLYNPASNTWGPAGSLTAIRNAHTATLLPSGKVLFAAGFGASSTLNSAELYLEDFGIADVRRPVISTATNPIPLGGSLTVTGTGFTGDSEASGGSSNNSATNYPLLQLRRLDSDQIVWASPATSSTRSATSYQSAPLSSLLRGQYSLSIIVNGIASSATMVNVGVSTQTISFGTAPTIVVGGTGTVTATATSGLPVTYSTASTACTVNTNSGLVTAVAAGTCVIAANQPGNANYTAAPQVTQSIVIGVGSQVISFGPAPAVVVGGSGSLTATSDKGLVPVTFTSTTPSVCSVSAGTVTGVSTGICTIQANQAGNANISPASASLSFGVGGGFQTLIFGLVPTITTGGTGSIGATSDKGLTPVILTSTTPSKCSISAGTVTGLAVGTCTIQASQAGNATYNAATATLSFSVNAPPIVCDLHMNGNNPLLATVEGLILTRAMLGITGSAVTAGTGIATPWATIRDGLNANCGTAFQ